MNIAFLSSSSFTLPILKSILESTNKTVLEVFLQQIELLPNSHHQMYSIDKLRVISELNTKISLKLIVSQPATFNREKLVYNPIVDFAKNYISSQENNDKFDLWTPENFNKDRGQIFPDVDVAITASFGQFVTNSSLNIPKFGFINWHPSLLPKYRGATPLQSALFKGDKKVGLSWINMTKEMDGGDIFLQIEKEVKVDDTFDTLINYFGEMGSQTWSIAIVNKILNISQKQNLSEVTLCNKLEKEAKFFDPNNELANQVKSQYQAFINFPTTAFMDSYFNCEVKLLEIGNILDLQDTQSESTKIFGSWLVFKQGKKQLVYLVCKNKTLLEIRKVVLSTGKKIDFSGYQFG